LLNCRGVGGIVTKLSFDREETLGGPMRDVDAAAAPLEHPVLKAA
jgi:hypothetical protein